MTEKTVQCRYTGKYQRCGNQAVDPVGEVLLCTEHLGRTMELLRARGFTITAPNDSPKYVCPRCEREVCGCPSLDQVRYIRGDKEYIP